MMGIIPFSILEDIHTWKHFLVRRSFCIYIRDSVAQSRPVSSKFMSYVCFKAYPILISMKFWILFNNLCTFVLLQTTCWACCFKGGHCLKCACRDSEKLCFFRDVGVNASDANAFVYSFNPPSVHTFVGLYQIHWGCAVGAPLPITACMVCHFNCFTVFTLQCWCDSLCVGGGVSDSY